MLRLLSVLGAAIGVCALPSEEKYRTADSGGSPVVLLNVVADSSGKEGLKLNEEGLSYIKGLPAPLFLVPILGVYRSGKSMLLNQVIGKHCFLSQGGDQTVTRGIFVYGETRPEGGTIVWMDTEGLFSPESSANFLGVRISTLAAMVASVVMLNTFGLYDERFVGFFEEQQKLSHIMKDQLEGLEGLPEEAKSLMMRKRLPVFWVLSKPQNLNSNVTKVLSQFLDGKPWRDEFENMAQIIPFAVNDVTRMSDAYKLSQDDLNPEYLNQASKLRGRILDALNRTSGLSPNIVVLQLRSLLNLVSKERFDPEDAFFIFEEAKAESLSSMIPCFEGECSLAAVGLLKEDIADQKQKVADLRRKYVEQYKFDSAWSKKSELIVADVELGILKQVVGQCIGLPVMKPVLPWLVGLYFRDRTDKFVLVLKRMARHMLVLFSLSLLDIRKLYGWLALGSASTWHDAIVDTAVEISALILMYTPTLIFSQAEFLTLCIFWMGCCFACYSLVRFLLHRPERLESSALGQVRELEIQMLRLGNQADFAVQRELAKSAIDAARCLTEGSAAKAADNIFCGLVGLREASQSAGSGSWIFKGEKSRARALKLAKEAVDKYRGRASLCAACEANRLLALTADREWEDLSLHMADLLLQMEAAPADGGEAALELA